MHDLHVWPDVEADGGHPSQTPGKTSDPEDKMSSLAKVHEQILFNRLPWFVSGLRTWKDSKHVLNISSPVRQDLNTSSSEFAHF